MITAFNLAGTGVSNMLNNPKLIAKAVYMSILIFGAFHFTRLGVQIMGGVVMANLGKPQLVRETSKIHTRNFINLPYLYGKRFFNRMRSRTEKELLDGVILDKKLEEQLREISYAVLNRKKHYAPCKNLMFYGPPGTGKTLFAKKLATQSGLDYAVMVGSDIAPLGANAVLELNKLFDWAERQTNGIILFIDEADAFLKDRRGKEMSEHMRHTINSFLYRTGSPSDKVVLVMATNTPDMLDEAVHDRIDEIVAFDRPSEAERKNMLYHYLVKYCTPPNTTYEKAIFAYKHPRSLYKGKKLIRMEDIDHDFIN
jgi:ATPase family AAA domain-containing protein 3A/B